MIPIFILLSQNLALISSTIFVGKQTFNLPSTASWLIFVHPPSFFYHYLRPRHPNQLSTTCYELAMGPSPRLRDVGPTTNATSKHTSSDPSHTCPSPSRGMWASSCSLDRANRGGRDTWGDQGSRRPTRYVMKYEPQRLLWLIFVI